MFYFFKKNYSFFYALKKTYIFLIKDFLKMIFYTILLDLNNSKIRLYRLQGLIASILGFRSYKRP